MKLGLNTKDCKLKTQKKKPKKNTTSLLTKSLTQRKCRKITKNDSEIVWKQAYRIKIIQNKEEGRNLAWDSNVSETFGL